MLNEFTMSLLVPFITFFKFYQRLIAAQDLLFIVFQFLRKPFPHSEYQNNLEIFFRSEVRALL